MELWPNFGKSPLWACVKQLVYHSADDIKKTNFRHFCIYSCNPVHFKLI